jgi:hypothetical protein
MFDAHRENVGIIPSDLSQWKFLLKWSTPIEKKLVWITNSANQDQHRKIS